MASKPLYRVRISSKGTGEDPGYYAADKAWQSTPKNEADKLTHKQARAISGRMKRLGYASSVEPAG